MEIPVSGCWHFDLLPGNDVPVFYLEPQDAKNLVDLHLRNAPWNWHYDGNASFCVNHGYSQRGRVRPKGQLEPAPASFALDHP